MGDGGGGVARAAGSTRLGAAGGAKLRLELQRLGQREEDDRLGRQDGEELATAVEATRARRAPIPRGPPCANGPQAQTAT
eukprot:8486246-Alexandrium_andersonii.AAC.1